MLYHPISIRRRHRIKIAVWQPTCTAACMSSSATALSLYEQLGGQPAVDLAVDSFYRKVLTDDRVKGFFDGIDMDKQMAKQKAFLTMVFGGPNNYTGKDLRRAHEKLVARGLADAHFDAITAHLRATLRELAISEDTIADVLIIVASTRDDVLGR